MDFETAVKRSIKQSEKLLESLKTVRLLDLKQTKIKSNTLFKNRESIYDQISVYKEGEKFIYVFSICKWEVNVNKIKDAYAVFDVRNKPRVLGKTHNTSRYNHQHNSEFLYVGSSKNLIQRIKQHLGDGNKRTYSLDLIYWFPKDVDIAINIYSLSSQEQELIETIEQAIWDEAKPLFGKRSGH
ncbi:MAG: GIY-YIG nuclease family protein [Cyclobacteriaceae bacterium]